MKSEGKIFVGDWKKENMPEGPLTEIRYLPEHAKERLRMAGVEHTEIQSELPNHFWVVAIREEG